MRNVVLLGAALGLCLVPLAGNPVQAGLFDNPPKEDPYDLITILFAGNNQPGEGGPYWRPPGEDHALEGQYSDGYFTHDSRQRESGMNIVVQVAEREDQAKQPITVDTVTLIWKGTQNPDTEPEELGRYEFPSLFSGDVWNMQTDGFPHYIETEEGVYYSFDIEAEYEDQEVFTVEWVKTAPHTGPGNPVPPLRRLVQLSCTPVDADYFEQPFYLHVGDYELITDDDNVTHDRYHHDSGPEAGDYDTGVLTTELPSSIVEQRFCEHAVGYWFDDSVCVPETDDLENPFKITSIYFHVWVSRLDHPVLPDYLDIGWGKLRTHWSQEERIDNRVWWPFTEYKSQIEYQGDPTTSSHHKLIAWRLDTEDTAISDNNIYEMFIYAFGGTTSYPSFISSREIVSFVMFNVPAQGDPDLQGDSDSDGLTDDEELYEHFTSPFLADTDNDRYRDGYEVLHRTDPNNYLSWPRKPPLPYEQD